VSVVREFLRLLLLRRYLIILLRSSLYPAIPLYLWLLQIRNWLISSHFRAHHRFSGTEAYHP